MSLIAVPRGVTALADLLAVTLRAYRQATWVPLKQGGGDAGEKGRDRQAFPHLDFAQLHSLRWSCGVQGTVTGGRRFSRLEGDVLLRPFVSQLLRKGKGTSKEKYLMIMVDKTELPSGESSMWIHFLYFVYCSMYAVCYENIFLSFSKHCIWYLFTCVSPMCIICLLTLCKQLVHLW